MIDIHCHLLPAVDDGAKNWDVTLEMCRMARQDGTRHIVATPHANAEFPYDRQRHEETLAELRRQVPELGLSLGCDFHLSYENLDDLRQNPGRYTISGTSYLLVELSDYSVFNMENIFCELQRAGLRPILTHPERNRVLLSNPSLVARYIDVGCLMQLTANSLTGRWGRPSQKMAETMLKNNQAHFLASDAHGLRQRPPLLGEARKAAARLIGEQAATRLVEDNPQAVLANQPLPQTA